MWENSTIIILCFPSFKPIKIDLGGLYVCIVNAARGVAKK
jgi:hypothetical protein